MEEADFIKFDVDNDDDDDIDDASQKLLMYTLLHGKNVSAFAEMFDALQREDPVMRDGRSLATATFVVRTALDRQAQRTKPLGNPPQGCIDAAISFDQDVRCIVEEDEYGEKYSSAFRAAPGDLVCVTGAVLGKRTKWRHVLDVDRYVDYLGTLKAGGDCVAVTPHAIHDGVRVKHVEANEITLESETLGVYVLDISDSPYIPLSRKVWVFPDRKTAVSHRDVLCGRVLLTSPSRRYAIQSIVMDVSNVARLQPHALVRKSEQDAESVDTIQSYGIPTTSIATSIATDSSENKKQYDPAKPAERITHGCPQQTEGLTSVVNCDGVTSWIQSNRSVWVERSWSINMCQRDVSETTEDGETRSVDYVPDRETETTRHIDWKFARPIPFDVDPSKRMTDLFDVIVDYDTYSDLFFAADGVVPEDGSYEEAPDRIDLTKTLVQGPSESLFASELQILFRDAGDLTREMISAARAIRSQVQSALLDASFLTSLISRYAGPIATRFVDAVSRSRRTIINTARQHGVHGIEPGTDLLSGEDGSGAAWGRVAKYYAKKLHAFASDWSEAVRGIVASVLGACISICKSNNDNAAYDIISKYYLRSLAKRKTAILQIGSVRRQILKDRGVVVKKMMMATPTPDRSSATIRKPVVSNESHVVHQRLNSQRRRRLTPRTRLLDRRMVVPTVPARSVIDQTQHSQPVFWTSEPVSASQQLSDDDDLDSSFKTLMFLVSTAPGVTKETKDIFLRHVTKGEADARSLRECLRKLLVIEVPLKFSQSDPGLCSEALISARMTDLAPNDNAANAHLLGALAKCVSSAEDRSSPDFAAFVTNRLAHLLSTRKSDSNLENIVGSVASDIAKFRADKLKSLMDLENSDLMLYNQLTNLSGLDEDTAMIAAKSHPQTDQSPEAPADQIFFSV